MAARVKRERLAAARAVEEALVPPSPLKQLDAALDHFRESSRHWEKRYREMATHFIAQAAARVAAKRRG